MQIFQRVINGIRRNIEQISVLRVPAELTYKAALEEYIDNLPTLSPTDFRIVETLQREGVCVTSLEELKIPSTPLIINSAKKIIPKLITTNPSNRKEYSIHATPVQIMEYPEIFLWGLEQRLLNIAENYLGLPVAYHGAYFRRELVNGIQIKTRQWHTDMEDYRLLKIIIYLNDVSDNDGPFQYIPKHLTSLVNQSLNYKYGYIRDKRMLSLVPPLYWRQCIGSTGTVIFADTGSIFHRGKLPVALERFAIFFDYTSRQPKRPYYCKSSLSKDDLLLLAKNLSEPQKKCIFWHPNFVQKQTVFSQAS
jgi:hypothetical protein